MCSVHDVARFIVGKTRPVTAMKLQKLLYYCQAWSLVWDERPLFGARIEAWTNGPVIPEIYKHHRGQFSLSKWEQGNVHRIDKAGVETIEAVLKFYGGKTAQWLSDLTHQEAPWRDARRAANDGKRGSHEIALSAMHEYYCSL